MQRYVRTPMVPPDTRCAQLRLIDQAIAAVIAEERVPADEIKHGHQTVLVETGMTQLQNGYILIYLTFGYVKYERPCQP